MSCMGSSVCGSRPMHLCRWKHAVDDLRRVAKVTHPSFGNQLRESSAAAVTAPRKPQVGRAGRFGTKGLAITFISTEADAECMAAVQKRFEVEVRELPEHIEVSSYMQA
eukprot:RCo047017